MHYKKTLTVLVIMIISGFLNASNIFPNLSGEQNLITDLSEQIATRLNEFSSLPSDTPEKRINGIAKVLGFLNTVSSGDISPEAEEQASRKMQLIIEELYKLSLSTPNTMEEKSEVLEKTKNFFEELPLENLLPLPSDTKERNTAILKFSEVPRSSSSGMSSSNTEEESSSKEMLLLLVELNQLLLLPQDMGKFRRELERAIKNFLSTISSEDLPVEGEMRETLMRLSKLLISSLDAQERQKKTLIAVLSFLNGISFKILEEEVRASREIGGMIIKLHELSATGLPDTEEERIKVILAALKKEVALLDQQK